MTLIVASTLTLYALAGGVGYWLLLGRHREL